MTKHKTKNKLIDFTFYTGSLCMIIVAILIHIILYKSFFKIYNFVLCKNPIPIQSPPNDDIFQNQQPEEMSQTTIESPIDDSF